MSDAAGDMAKTPAEEDPTTESASAPEGPGTTGGAGGDDAFDDAAADTVKSPGAGDDAA